MNKLATDDRVKVVAALVEGCSPRSIVHMTGVHRATIQKLLVEIETACSNYQDKAFRNLPCKRIQRDEIWSIVGANEKNSRGHKDKEWGDVWTWTALCPDTRFVRCWLVGPGTAPSPYHFMHDLKERLANRVQLTTDRHSAHLSTTEQAFSSEIDYAQLVNIYGNQVGPIGQNTEVRYSPAQCMGTKKAIIIGKPDISHVSTSHTERQNLTMRRFTRLSNAFSKKMENHEAAVALQFIYYIFARVHQTLRIALAMAAAVSSHVWGLEEVIALVL